VPAVSSQLEFRLAAVAFELASPQMPFDVDWRDRPLAGFLREGTKSAPPADRVRVAFHPGSVPDLSGLPVVHRTNRLLTWHQTGSLLWLRWEHPLRPEMFWVAEIALEEDRVEVFFPREAPYLLPLAKAKMGQHAPEFQATGRTAGPGLPAAFLAPIYRFLAVVFLAPRRGLLHHAATAEYRGRMWLFPGRSGRGKSELAELLARHPEFRVVGDDSVATRDWEVPQGGRGRFRAYGTPWPSTAGFAINAAAPVGGLFFLEHGLENRLELLSPREALHRLLPTTNLLWWHPEWLTVMLDGCNRLANSVPAWRFSFAPTLAAAEVLAEFLACDGQRPAAPGITAPALLAAVA
jgi:hypothetical protein